MSSNPTLLIRDAVASDLPAIVALLADDPFGREREAVPLDPAYARALAAIEADPNNRQLVAIEGGDIVGCFQLTFIPGLGRRGRWRAQIESVRVATDRRGGGRGAAMMAWAIDRARERGCALVQLTTDKRRDDAHRFYRRLGFVATHEGMKLLL
jgi:ribosomal protein S18 acetylase RimI-like enzyme